MVKLVSLDVSNHGVYMQNAIGEYELDLRGNKLGAIENLAVTHDIFDCLDLSDNDIVRLEGFPPLKKLKTLLLHNNRITRLDRDIGSALPFAHRLIEAYTWIYLRIKR